MDATVTHSPGNELHAPIVTVQTHLAQQNTWAMGEISTSVDLVEHTGWFGGRLGHGVQMIMLIAVFVVA